MDSKLQQWGKNNALLSALTDTFLCSACGRCVLQCGITTTSLSAAGLCLFAGTQIPKESDGFLSGGKTGHSDKRGAVEMQTLCQCSGENREPEGKDS